MSTNSHKRRKLNFSKCAFCRKDKKRCTPSDRVWPGQKCDRCEKMSLECSKNENLKAAGSNSYTINRTITVGREDANDQNQQDVTEFRNLALKLSWLQRFKEHTSRMKSMTEVLTLSPGKDTDIDNADFERERILTSVSQMLRSDDAFVREAAFAILSTAIFGIQSANSVSDSASLLEICRSSDRVEVELSIWQQYLPTRVTTENARGMADAINDYNETCKRYMERLEQIDDSTFLGIAPEGTSLTFSQPQVLNLVIQYTPELAVLEQDCFGRNCLQAAVETCEEKDIKSFIQKWDGAKFLELARHRCRMDRSILHIAAMRGINCVIAKASGLSHGSFLELSNAKDGKGRTPLSYAVINGNASTARLLLSKGANPRVPDYENRNALHHAVMTGQEDITKDLLGYGSILRDAADDLGYRPIHLALKHGHLKVAKLFPKISLCVLRADYRDSPLIIASEEGHIPVMKWLLDLEMDEGVCRVDIQHRTRRGDTALMRAAENGKLDAVKFLISRGADANRMNGFGITARDAARGEGHFEVASYLDGVISKR